MSKIERDRIVPEAQARHLLGDIGPMTMWRRTKYNPDFPKLIKMGSRNYRSLREIEEYIQKLIARASR